MYFTAPKPWCQALKPRFPAITPAGSRLQDELQARQRRLNFL